MDGPLTGRRLKTATSSGDNRFYRGGSTSSAGSPTSSGEFFAALGSIYTAGEMCDVVIELVNGNQQRFRCHRVVLSASSPFFRAMFTSDLAEARSDVIRLGGDAIEPGAFRVLLDFMYSNELHVNDGNVQGVLRGACYLLMRDVEMRCCSVIARTLTPANCFQLLELSTELASDRLTERVLAFILRQGFASLARLPGFAASFEVNLMRRAFESSLSWGLTEEALFDILLSWIHFDPPSRSRHFPSLVKLIKVQHTQPGILAAKLRNDPLLAEDDLCKKLIESIGFKSRESPGLGDGSCTSFMSPRRGLICTNTAMDAIFAFDPCSRQWSPSQQPVPPNIDMTAATLFEFDGEHSLGVMGSDIRGLISTIKNEELGLGSPVVAFDSKTQNWVSLPSLNSVRCRPAVVHVPYADATFAAGGILDSNDILYCRQLNSCEVRHSSKPCWTSISPLRGQGGEGVRLVSHLDRVFAIGGVCCPQEETRFHQASNRVNYLRIGDVFDINFEVRTEHVGWCELAPMKTRRTHFGVGVLADRIYAIGGHSDDGAESSAEYFDPEKNAWFDLQPLVRPAPVVNAIAFGGLLTCLVSQLNEDRPGIAAYELVTYDPRDNSWHGDEPVPLPCKVGISYPSITVVPAS